MSKGNGNETRDDNSSEIFTPRGIEELRNGNLPFLKDQGRKNLFLREFRGVGCYFILLIFQDLLFFLVLLPGIITENTNLWHKNSIMIKKIPIF
jgi:hypothetical protein